MRIGSLFSGIGGLELGLEWSGLGHTVWQVERDEFCRRVLAAHWPDAERFDDVCKVGRTTLAPVDLICGGFPCQDVSSAGKGAGLAGERSGLWFEFARVIDETSPRIVVVENVASGTKLWLGPVTAQLGQLGYETLPLPISAQAVGAPHFRRRIFVLAVAADPDRVRLWQQQNGEDREGKTVDRTRDAPNPESQRWKARNDDSGLSGILPETSGHGYRDTTPVPVRPWSTGAPVSPVCGVDDGIHARPHRIRALGNAVVPACAEVVGHVIQELLGGGEWLS